MELSGRLHHNILASIQENYMSPLHTIRTKKHCMFLKIFWIVIEVQEKPKTILFAAYCWYIFEIRSSYFLQCVHAFGGLFETVIQ